jgi:L-lactate dehydrogenase (cytochrome)
VLRNVEGTSTVTTVLGSESALPFGLAPTGFTRMMHAEGERAVAAAAERAGIPYALSTMGTTSAADVAEAAPSARKWFQLYLWRDRGLSRRLVEDAKAAGYEALLVTVDVPVNGNRLRDLRNGMTIPPQLSLRTFLDASYRWEWWFNFLTTEPLSFAFDAEGSLTDLVTKLYDPTTGFEDLEWLRELWDGPILVKGIQTVADAEAVVDRGADGVILSNHGGRQLDRAPVPLHLLPAVAEAIGERGTVMVDTGIMNGGDVVAAHALGADFALVGRAYLYGLMAGGEAGVDRAIAILAGEAERTLKMLGVTSVDRLTPEHVRLMTRRMPVQ